MARKIDYENLTVEDLQYLADRQWLVAEGDHLGHETSKAVAAWREDGTVPEAAGGDDDNDGDEGIEYKDATNEQLKAELKSRGLEVSGKKDELIARLEADDAANADDDDEEADADADEEDDIPEE